MTKSKLNIMDKLKNIDFKGKEEVHPEEYEIIVVEKERIDILEKKFDYSQIEDEAMREDLQRYDGLLHQITNKFYTQMGDILLEANHKYANFKNGIFGTWLEYIGIPKKSAERLINRSKFIATNCRSIEDKEYFETLPLSLSYEVSAPNADPILVEAVLSKRISTRKEFIEMKKDLLEVEDMDKTVTFENVIGEMKIFNERYMHIASSIEKIRTSHNSSKLSKIYSKIEKMNKELETIIKEMEK